MSRTFEATTLAGRRVDETGNGQADVDAAVVRVSTVTRTEYGVEFVDDIGGAGGRRLAGLTSAKGARRSIVFMDSGAARHYRDSVIRTLGACGVEATVICFETSESEKSMGAVAQVVEKIEAFKPLRRSEPIVCIGGGVMLDIVGFAASLYKRGTPYIRVPSTLLAMVDAGIGVKTGVSFGKGKNRIGTYHAPLNVLIDIGLLRTLPARHMRCGMAEIVKMAVIKDAELFRMLEEQGAAGIRAAMQRHSDQRIVARAVTLMLEELAPNLFEDQLTRIVDFGHTFSQGIEMESGWKHLHGEAVALDMALSTAIAHRRGLLSPADTDRVLGLFGALGLPVLDESLDESVLLASLDDAARHRDGAQNVPLPCAIGSGSFVSDITPDEVRAALQFLGER